MAYANDVAKDINGLDLQCSGRFQAGHIPLRGIPFYTHYLNVAGKYISKKNICTKFEVTRSPAIEYHALFTLCVTSDL